MLLCAVMNLKCRIFGLRLEATGEGSAQRCCLAFSLPQRLRHGIQRRVHTDRSRHLRTCNSPRVGTRKTRAWCCTNVPPTLRTAKAAAPTMRFNSAVCHFQLRHLLRQIFVRVSSSTAQPCARFRGRNTLGKHIQKCLCSLIELGLHLSPAQRLSDSLQRASLSIDAHG